MRADEVNGKEYNFISDEEFDILLSENKFCCVEKYQVANGDTWKYAVKIEDLKKYDNCILTCNPKSIVKLNLLFNWCELTVIEIKAELIKRVERYLKRDNYTMENVNELVRRFIKDEEDFINVMPKVKIENNDNIEDALKQFDKTIRRYSNGKTKSR